MQREPLVVITQPTLNCDVTRKDLMNGKGLFLLDIILILAKKIKMMSIVNDLVRPGPSPAHAGCRAGAEPREAKF